VAAGQRKADQLRGQAEKAVRDLTRRLREAEAVQARLARLQAPASTGAAAGRWQYRTAGGSPACWRSLLLCGLWTPGGAALGRPSPPGHRRHGPYRARVYALTDGVISRESTNAYGGITLYLQGDNGAEHYYAHLSGYAVAAGTRVKPGS
jgi:hypothetical protein